MNARDVLLTFAGNFPGFQAAIIVIFSTIGLGLVFYSLYQMATWGRRARQGESSVGMLFRGFAGAALLGLGEILARQTRTLLDENDPRSILDYQNPEGSEAAMLATVLVGLITLIGWIGVGKGWLEFSRLGSSAGGQRQGAFANAFVLLLCGTIAANVMVFSDIVAATFGVENYIRRLIP